MRRFLSLTAAILVLIGCAACTRTEIVYLSEEPTAVTTVSTIQTTIQTTATTQAKTTRKPTTAHPTVADLQDFADRMEEDGYKIEQTQTEDGVVNIELTTPDKDDTDKTPTPVIPTRPTGVRTTTTTKAPTTTLRTIIATPVDPTPTKPTTAVTGPTTKRTFGYVTRPTLPYTTNQEHTPLPKSERYLYSVLTTEQKGWYDKIDAAVRALDPQVYLGTELINSGNYYIYYIYMYDNPELFYLGTNVAVYTAATGKQGLRFSYSDGEDYCLAGTSRPVIDEPLRKSILAKKKLFDQEVARIVATIPASAPDVDKELLIYDYILRTASYNMDAQWSGVAEDNWTAYGVLLNKKGVCESYAEAFQTLCNAVGINCAGVGGNAGDPHKWNAVQLDGEWYAVDVTFDDPVNGNPSKLYHDYFNLTTADMEAMGRTVDQYPLGGPICNGTKYSYQNYFGN